MNENDPYIFGINTLFPCLCPNKMSETPRWLVQGWPPAKKAFPGRFSHKRKASGGRLVSIINYIMNSSPTQPETSIKSCQFVARLIYFIPSICSSNFLQLLYSNFGDSNWIRRWNVTKYQSDDEANQEQVIQRKLAKNFC